MYLDGDARIMNTLKLDSDESMAEGHSPGTPPCFGCGILVGENYDSSALMKAWCLQSADVDTAYKIIDLNAVNPSGHFSVQSFFDNPSRRIKKIQLHMSDLRE